ncbi:MAG: 5-formyltetrahydrofolate cyclo-ligase [Anditalea sp.]
MKSKIEIRDFYKSKRNQLGPDERQFLSAKITEKALQYLLLKDSIKHIHVFLPIEKLNEVNTIPLINGLQEQGREIYTSVADFFNGEMKTVKMVIDQQFAEGRHGVPVPVEIVEGRDSLLQLVFIPLLAYDLNGHRLGYGKGFYDRFLARLSPGVLKVGLSFFPAEPHIPTEKHDVPLDLFINPEEVIEIK